MTLLIRTVVDNIASNVSSNPNAGFGISGDHIAPFGDSGDHTADFGVSSYRNAGANPQEVANVMPSNQMSAWKQSIQDVDFKVLNLVHFRAKSVPSWFFVVFLVFILIVLWLIITYPLPAIVTGIGNAAARIKQYLKPT